MIAYLEGTILSKQEDSLVLLTHGVGYKLFTTTGALTNTIPEEQKSFWIHHHIREQANDLYAFENKVDIDFFNLLLGVNGIGPKSALGIMNTASTESLIQSIGHNDLTHLTKVAGIGKKSAEKILLELKDKVGTISPIEEHRQTGGSSDAIEALIALGYSEKEARQAVQGFDPELGTQEIITKALQSLH